MKKNLFNLFAILCLSLTMASCVDNEDPKQYLMGQFVIEGINPNYTLYAREGYVVHLDPTSVTSLTGTKGFGDNFDNFDNGGKRRQLLGFVFSSIII